jgi:hypothetical protein
MKKNKNIDSTFTTIKAKQFLFREEFKTQINYKKKDQILT